MQSDDARCCCRSCCSLCSLSPYRSSPSAGQQSSAQPTNANSQGRAYSLLPQYGKARECPTRSPEDLHSLRLHRNSRRETDDADFVQRYAVEPTDCTQRKYGAPNARSLKPSSMTANATSSVPETITGSAITAANSLIRTGQAPASYSGSSSKRTNSRAELQVVTESSIGYSTTSNLTCATPLPTIPSCSAAE